MMSDSNPTITVRLPTSEIQAIDRLALKLGVVRNDVVRGAVRLSLALGCIDQRAVSEIFEAAESHS